tara:strand:+ start:95 stop:277 length:183 start_codon:yes stop_codon:yes gene_type:complete
MRYKITITTGAHTSTVWVNAESEQEAVQQVTVTAERDSINKRMMTEYDSALSTEKHTVTA